MNTPETPAAKTPETIRITEQKALNAVTSARCQLMLGGTAVTVFFAALALRLSLKIDWFCRTAWTDGKSIGFNPDFILSLSKDELKGVIVHEVLHVVYRFFARLGNRDLRDFNSAHDLTINQIILASGFKLPSGCLMPGKGSYEGFPENGSAEEYYALIAAGKAAKEKAEQPKEPETDESAPDEDSDESVPETEKPENDADETEDASEDAEESDDSADGSSDDSEDENGDESGEGSGDSGDSEDGEDKSDGSGSEDAGESEDVDEGNCGGCKRPSASQSEAKELDEDWKQYVSSARDFAHGKGKLPGGLEQLCNDMLNPSIPWTERLQQFIAEKAKTDYSWTRPNRRFIASGDHFPSLHSDVLGHLVVSVDTSGSVFSPVGNSKRTQLEQFRDELGGILECMPFKVTIIYHHASVYRTEEWTPTDGEFKLDGIQSGGTSHVDVFRTINELPELPVAVVCLTDLYTDFPDYVPSMPVLWACTSEIKSAPFGEVMPVNFAV